MRLKLFSNFFSGISLFQRRGVVSTFVILCSSVLAAVFNWIQLSLITKVLSLQVVGVYTLSLAISNPVFQFFSLQLSPLYVTNRDHSYSFSDFFALRLITSVASMFFCFVLVAIVFKSDLGSIGISLLVFFNYAIDSVIDIFKADFQRNNRFNYLATCSIIQSAAGLIFFCVSLLCINNLALALALGCAGKVISFSVYYKNKSSLRVSDITKPFSCKFTYRLVQKAFPLGISLLVGSLNVNISKYIVNYKFGIQDQAAYSSLSYVVVLGTLIVAPIGQVLMPKLSQLFAQGDYKSIKFYHKGFVVIIIIWGGLLTIGSYLLGYKALRILFSPEIAEYYWLLPYIIGFSVPLFVASANGYVLTSVGIVTSQAYFSLATLAINILLYTILIPSIPMSLVPAIGGVGFIIQFILGNIALQRVLTTSPDRKNY